MTPVDAATVAERAAALRFDMEVPEDLEAWVET